MPLPQFADSPLIVPFIKVNAPFGWLGNMSPYPVEYDGAIWLTSEHLFQALRLKEDGVVTKDGNEVSVRDLLRAVPSPMYAKMTFKKLIRENPGLLAVQPRSQMDLDLMRKVLRLKFDQHARLAKALCRLDPASVFVEDATNRRGESAEFWGARLVASDLWEGHNWLGQLLGELRDELLQKQSAKPQPQ